MKSSHITLVGTMLVVGFLSTTTTRAEDNTTNFLYNDGLLHTAVGDVTVGSTGTNNYGEVSNGSILTNTGGYGIVSQYSPAAHNLAVVSGAGSLWTVDPSYPMVVGFYSGEADLLITNSGRVQSPGGGIIGYYYNTVSNNTVTVTGSGSSWDVGYLSVGGNGFNNTLQILNGATVTNTGSTSMGVATTSSNNLILVSGSGSHFSTLGSDFGIGGGGGNTLVVANGGSLDSINFRNFAGSSPNQILVTNGGFVQTIGLSFGESATVGGNLIRVSGAGSVYTNTGSMQIGQSSSNNTLVIDNGGKMYNRDNTLIGSGGAFNNILVTGAGSLLDMNASGGPSTVTYLGYTGDGNTLTISNGGQAKANAFYTATSSNRVTVSDSGSALNIGSILYASFGGYGNQVIVTNGGKVVTPTTTMGYYGIGGLIEVTGSGSVYSNTGTFQVSVLGGTNAVAVRNGGSLYVGDSMNLGNSTGEGDRLITTGGGQVKVLTNLVIGNSVGNSGLISDPGSVLDVGGYLYVGNVYANNSLVITNGAHVNTGGGLIGNYGQLYGYNVTNNTILVTGAGSVWSNTTYAMYIGNIGENNHLRIENGGKVYNAAGTIMGNASSASNNSIVVTGPGSLFSSPGGEIHVGSAEGSNAMYVSNGGRVETLLATLFVGTLSSRNYLEVTGGGQVQSAQGIIGYLGSPSYSGHHNAALVSGTGSVWSNTTYPIYVGYQGVSNTLTVANGGKVYTPTLHVGYSASASNNTVNVIGPGALLQVSSGAYVGNNGTTAGDGGRLNISDGGTLDTPLMASGISGSGTISNRGGIYQFPTAAPSITPNTANSITLSNGTISYRDVASANIFNSQVANIAFSGNNAFRLNNSSNSTVSTYTFNTGLGATNYTRLELVNGGSRWQGTTLNIGSGGSLLVSNSANASISANVSIAGLAEVVNSKATFGGTVNISGRFVSDPSTNTYLADVTVVQSGTMAGGSGDLFDFKKSFYIHSTNQVGFNLSQSAVEFSGGGMHTNAITGKDLGGAVTAFDIAFTYQTNFAYGELHIESAADQICFECGNIPVAPSNALYVGWLDLLTSTNFVANLHTPTSINIYYSGLDTRNAYLGNQTFQLTACDGVTLGGFLMPVIPEPSTVVLLLLGAGCALIRNRRNK